jgi:hypothetical protein
MPDVAVFAAAAAALHCSALAANFGIWEVVG